MTNKIILKYNAVVGNDPLPRVRELVKALALRVDDVGEESPIAGKRLRVVCVSGEPGQISEFARQLHRLPSISAKLV